ncbi:hypothetical protein LAJ19_18310 (plasmid) [Deinococcus taeanensis]|uniref:hypothetical protein n=1 Tax=Deinococcus taeanensis TaxID=2737050 RepID=UPI001CDC98E7|nr:hypothetical protein [Deinococcus taeanensis]UBV45077.1 hypothetical protein LAJ19_18310 [Deinococcus taeanensis]
MWYALSDGVRTGDRACVELAVRFLEADLDASYSGYARSRIARALRRAALTPDQTARLRALFWTLLETGRMRTDFRDSLRLWTVLATPEDHTRLQRYLQTTLHLRPVWRDRLTRLAAAADTGAPA